MAGPDRDLLLNERAWGFGSRLLFVPLRVHLEHPGAILVSCWPCRKKRKSEGGVSGWWSSRRFETPLVTAGCQRFGLAFLD